MAEKDELDELLYLRQENIKLKARLDTNRAQVKKMAEEKRKVCRVVNHIYIGGICAECGKREMPPKKAVEHSVQRTGFACDVDGCKKPGVVHLCEDHGLQ